VTADPSTAPDRLRALFAEFDCINPEDLYDAVVADPRMVMDVLRCTGFVKQQWVHCSACGESAPERSKLVHRAHYTAQVNVSWRWSGGAA
jgi:hypothetical protein